MVLDTECMEKVSVFLSAKGLEKIGMFRLALFAQPFSCLFIFHLHFIVFFSGKIDPFAVLYEVDPGNGRLIPMGITVSSLR